VDFILLVLVAEDFMEVVAEDFMEVAAVVEEDNI
jgi:hypothetical protein